MLKKLAAAGLCAAMSVTALSGCGKKTANISSDNIEKGEIAYPIKTDVTLKYWVRLPAALGTSVKNFGETDFAKEYMKRTGINVEYTHPAQGQETEVLNLLIASGDLPDIIETDWLSREPDSMISKNVILAMNDYMDDYFPNLKKYLSQNRDIDKQIKTDSGNYYACPFIRNDEKLLSTSGLMLRADWLKEFNLEVPETIDEWETVLEKFKTKCKTPISSDMFGLYGFCAAYNTSNSFYVRDGKIVYGPAEDSFKNFLKKMNEWYKKGYMDVNFAVLKNDLVRSNMLSGDAGVCFGAGGGTLGLMLNSMKGKAFDLTAAQFPSLKKGVRAEFGNKQMQYSSLNCAAITAKSKHPDLAARFLDYSYSEEGHMLKNFGIEGKSYEIKDGNPVYTKEITENPKGLAMSQAMALYLRASGEGPFVQDVRYIEQYYALPQQQKALELWSNNNHLEHLVPQITLTAEETTEYSSIMNEIETYRDEMIVNYIIGSESLDSYDEFVKTLNDMQLDKAIKIKQAAYDRFLKR